MLVSPNMGLEVTGAPHLFLFWLSPDQLSFLALYFCGFNWHTGDKQPGLTCWGCQGLDFGHKILGYSAGVLVTFLLQ